MKNGKKFVYLHPDEMNKVLAAHDSDIIFCGEPNPTKNTNNFKQISYLVDHRVKFEFICNSPELGSVIHYVCYKDGRDVIPSTTGLNAYTTLCQYYKPFEILHWDDDPALIEAFPCASPLIGYNPEYSGQRQEAWGYDLNQAYAHALTQMWIDTTVMPMQKNIRKGYEIGFTDTYMEDGRVMLKLAREGYSNYVFKIVPVPEGIKRFVGRWVWMKTNAKNKADKAKAKSMINYAIGFLKRRNPWIRNLVVTLCNEKISSLLDENSLFWNTDSIVSRVRRTDIEKALGDDCGLWKVEHKGVVAYKGNIYQWNNDTPTWRGMPKTWFKKGFDILVDKLPEEGNTYKYSPKKNRLEVIRYEEER